MSIRLLSFLFYSSILLFLVYSPPFLSFPLFPALLLVFSSLLIHSSFLLPIASRSTLLFYYFLYSLSYFSFYFLFYPFFIFIFIMLFVLIFYSIISSIFVIFSFLLLFALYFLLSFLLPFLLRFLFYSSLLLVPTCLSAYRIYP